MNKLKKGILTAMCASAILATTIYALTPISRITRGILNAGGTTALNGSTTVMSESPTNEFHIISVTATAVGAATTATNTFTVPFVAAPIVVRGMKSGASGVETTNALYTVTTATTTTVITTGLSTNAVTGLNNLPLLIYGYTRTGTFE